MMFRFRFNERKQNNMDTIEETLTEAADSLMTIDKESYWPDVEMVLDYVRRYRCEKITRNKVLTIVDHKGDREFSVDEFFCVLGEGVIDLGTNKIIKKETDHPRYWWSEHDEQWAVLFDCQMISREVRQSRILKQQLEDLMLATRIEIKEVN